ncbi:lipoprotein N-acyltransferase Lnb domain-containing protein [Lysobacter olei]
MRWAARVRALLAVALLGITLLQGAALAAPADDAATRPTLPAAPAPAPVSPASGPAPEIGMMTMLPGEIFWERFGHDAIVVIDPVTRVGTSYNFGFFDLDEPDFTSRFVRGDMRYQLVALPVDRDLATYEAEGRGVSIQWLDLPADDARQLAAALADNARPENARYRYDYFLDNCSTRVRDALDRALHGRLRDQLQGRSRGNTYRSEAMRLASPDFWMWLGFDVGLGPAADAPLALWEEAFVPMRLATALREVKHADGRPVVRGEHEILPHRLAPEPQESALRWWQWALPGLVLGGGLAWAGRRYPRATAAVALPFWTLAGAVGALLLFLWWGTEHRFAWANHNLFLLSPLAWVLLPGGVRLVRGRNPGVWFNRVLVVTAVLAVAGLFAHWLPLAPQRNAHWIALLLPIQLGLLAGLRRA